MINRVVSKEEWLKARIELLKKEKSFDKLRDQLSAERRDLPWIKVEKEYVFNGPSGQESLSNLFGDRSQLILYHFMLHPTWEEGCGGCSFMMDNLPSSMAHLESKDLKFVAISQAPSENIEKFKRRMGWNFKWLSSFGTSFNHDFRVSFTPEEIAKGEVYYNYAANPKNVGPENPGFSVFYKDSDGTIYHTYSRFARGLDMYLSTYHYLDMTPKGREEKSAMDWVRHHDKYPKK
jgi:predicted dithiol-disulfide oxidoreductase (DUF899 family)